MTDRLYMGVRTKDHGCQVFVSTNRVSKDLNPRLDLFNHSPDGFEWSYEGSGPAQLALAILADHLQHCRSDWELAAQVAKRRTLGEGEVELSADELAIHSHQSFKFRVIAKLEGNSWTLTSGDVSKHLADLAHERG